METAAVDTTAGVEVVDELPEIPGYYKPGKQPGKCASKKIHQAWVKRENKRYAAALRKQAKDDAAREAVARGEESAPPPSCGGTPTSAAAVQAIQAVQEVSPESPPRSTRQRSARGDATATTTLSPLVATNTTSPQRRNATPRIIRATSSARVSTGAGTFSPGTEAAWQRVRRSMARMATPERAIVVERLVTDPSIATKPPIAQKLLTTVKGLLRKQRRPVPLITPASEDPIDERAFHFHHPSREDGQHRLIGQDDAPTYNLQKAAQRAKNRAVKRNVDSILSAGDDEQIALACRDTTLHPDVRPYFERVWGTYNSEDAKIGRIVIRGMKSVSDRIATTKNKGMLSQTCRSVLSTMSMFFRVEGEEDPEKVKYRNAIHRQVFSSYSSGAARRMLLKGALKRKRFDAYDLSTFHIVDQEKKRWKYTDDEIDGMRKYLVGNVHARASPKSNDTVWERDYNGDVVRDADGEPIRIQKVLTSLCPTGMHVHMCKEENDGGYVGARSGTGAIKFSETTMRAYWPNWLKVMNDSDKMMCACETCTTTKDLNDAYNAKRRKIILSAQASLYEMADGPEKVAFENDLSEYKQEVFDASGLRYKHNSEWDVAEEYGCGVKIDIDVEGGVKSFPHYTCLLGQCEECDEKGYEPPAFEKRYENEMISYTTFTAHAQCSAHGSTSLEFFDKRPYARCMECDSLRSEEKKALNAKVQRKKFRTMHAMTLKKFLSIDGPFGNQLKKMYSHKYRAILLGSNYKMKTRYEHTRRRTNTIKSERDFAERWVPNPNGQAQFEYFNKDESLGMEGIVVFFKPKGKDTFETRVYTVLSTEKSQDGNIVYANTRIILEDIRQQLDGGDELAAMSHYPEVVNNAANKTDLEILDDTDGCSAQYRCGVALYMLHKLATELNIIYDRAIDCEGHGKKVSDGEGGQNKTTLSNEFRGNIEYQPEALDPLKNSVLLYQMENGKRRDLADLCHGILTRKRAKGAEKVEPNKRRKANEKSEKSIASRTYYVRKEGTAKWADLKMKAEGFPSGKSNGMKFHYNFRFEKCLGSNFAYRRIPCSCDGCYKKLQEPIATRYTGPCNTCYLWAIFEKKDGSGTGLNDWGMGRFDPTNECDVATYHASKADTLRELGKTYSTEIEVGHIGAHAVQDPSHDNFYLVMWDGEPKEAKEDNTIELDGEEYVLHKGDWYCMGIWLKKLRGARGWWTMDERSTIVRLETVVDSNVDVLEECEQNPLPSWLNSESRKAAEDNGAWRISDTNHNFIVEETRNRNTWEYEDEFIDQVRDELVGRSAWGTNVNGGGSDDEYE